jgi:hypothetical protein
MWKLFVEHREVLIEFRSDELCDEKAFLNSCKDHESLIELENVLKSF